MWQWWFSHAYLVLHNFKFKFKKWKKCLTKKIDFFCMILFDMWPTLWIPISSPMNIKKKQPNGQKKVHFIVTLNNELCYFQNSHTVYNISKCILWTFPNVNVKMIYQLKKLILIALFNALLFIKNFKLNTHDVVTIKKSKGHLYSIQTILKYFWKIM